MMYLFSSIGNASGIFACSAAIIACMVECIDVCSPLSVAKDMVKPFIVFNDPTYNPLVHNLLCRLVSTMPFKVRISLHSELSAHPMDVPGRVWNLAFFKQLILQLQWCMEFHTILNCLKDLSCLDNFEQTVPFVLWHMSYCDVLAGMPVDQE